MTVTLIGQIPRFRTGSNAGGGEGVVVQLADGRRETVYRYETTSVGGRPCDTSEETDRWRELRALGIVREGAAQAE